MSKEKTYDQFMDELIGLIASRTQLYCQYLQAMDNPKLSEETKDKIAEKSIEALRIINEAESLFFKILTQKGVGRPQNSPSFDRPAELARIKEAIKALRRLGIRADAITQRSIAERLSLGSPDTGADILRKRLRKCGVRSKWARFVVDVLSEPEKNTKPINFRDRKIIPGH